MKKKVSLEKKILAVLENELQESAGTFLTIIDIAKEIYGDGYQRRTAYIFNKQVKDRMSKVRELAEQNGMIVIPYRTPIKGNPAIKFKISGWKIADEGDETYIIDELLFKKRKGEEHSESFYKLKTNARRQGIVSGEKLRELAS